MEGPLLALGDPWLEVEPALPESLPWLAGACREVGTQVQTLPSLLQSQPWLEEKELFRAGHFWFHEIFKATGM